MDWIRRAYSILQPIFIVIVFLGLVLTLTHIFGVKTALGSTQTGTSTNLASARAALKKLPPSHNKTISVPKPQLDPCLHCHISGENANLWTPLVRWSLFGSFGLVFVFGVYRSTSTWLTKTRWKPLTQRSAEWVDERYQLSEPLSKVLNKPVPKFALRWWYCLGGITAFLFVTQAVTGILQTHS